MNLGAFFIVIFAEEKYGFKKFDDWNGFGYKVPILGFMMTLNMIALTGLPPTSGFVAKFYIFSDLIASKSFYWLAIVGAINAVVSLYYYFKLLKHMYLNDSNNDSPTLESIPNIVSPYPALIAQICPPSSVTTPRLSTTTSELPP